MKFAVVLIIGCALAFGAMVALGQASEARWLSVCEYLALFAMLSGGVWLFRKLGLVKRTVSPWIIGAAALLPVIYVSWSMPS